MEVRECIKRLYSQLPLNNTHKENNFYFFMEQELNDFVTAIKDVEPKSLEKILLSKGYHEHFLEAYTKKRFINLIGKINKDLLQILALCYKGNLAEADRQLNSLLRSQKYGRYLGEHYIDHVGFKIEKDRDYFRMRDADMELDESGNKKPLDNCWHVPYNKRGAAYTGRYSLLGYPCLYLGDSKETCNAEVGDLEKNIRWVSKFRFKKSISLYDLRIPEQKMIEEADEYDLFKMLLTYPFIALCTSGSQGKGFNEEYFIPQLLFHQTLIAGNPETSHIGIAYSSTKHPGGYNIVLPALYKGATPPIEGYSTVLSELLETQTPEIYRRK